MYEPDQQAQIDNRRYRLSHIQRNDHTISIGYSRKDKGIFLPKSSLILIRVETSCVMKSEVIEW